MSGNTFNSIFKVTTFGESHGPALGVIIDGCPAGLKLDLDLIRKDLDRRKTGQSKLVTPRKEDDEFEILSGIFEGVTTGTPIAFVVRNTDVKSKDYNEIKDLFRPGHADFTYFAKYGVRDWRGGGRSSARETVSRVIAGAVAKQLLSTIGVSFRGGIVQVGNVKAENYHWESVEENEVRGVDPNKVQAMIDEIELARKERDSVGAVVEVQALNVPCGLGEPVFEKLDAQIGGAMFSLPAVKAVEIGSGFSSVLERGSFAHDEFFPEGFSTNKHGGILGGISSGAPIVVRIAFKPTSSIPQERKTISKDFKSATVSTTGRHDACVGIRGVVIVESMLALVLVDAWMFQEATLGMRKHFSPHNVPKYGMKPE